jgi:hypothetical protein
MWRKAAVAKLMYSPGTCAERMKNEKDEEHESG